MKLLERLRNLFIENKVLTTKVIYQEPNEENEEVALKQPNKPATIVEMNNPDLFKQ